MGTGMTLEKKTPMDRIKEITGQLETGIAEIFTSEKYTKWLNTMSRFHNYSLNNTVLISMQKPDAPHGKTDLDGRSKRVKRRFVFSPLRHIRKRWRLSE